MSEQPVAPADMPQTTEGEEGVHPIVVNPDQPVFPRPVGVADSDLEDMGVKHGHVATSKELEGQTGKLYEPEEGSRPSNEPEGKPRDPKADEKAKAANKVAEANKQTVQVQQPQGQ